MAAAMSREAKLLPGVLPIQDTPIGVSPVTCADRQRVLCMSCCRSCMKQMPPDGLSFQY